jgi:hypothetical protein
MRKSAREAGRDPSAIEVTCGGDMKRETAEAAAAAGATRLVVSPPTGDLAALPGALERFRREVIEPLS